MAMQQYMMPGFLCLYPLKGRFPISARGYLAGAPPKEA